MPLLRRSALCALSGLSGLCALLAAALLGACSSDLLNGGEPDEPLALSPNVAFVLTEQAADGASRGFPVNSVNDIADFRVDAYLNRYGSADNFFSNTAYEAAAGDAGLNRVYRSDPAYLWPTIEGDQMSFVAVAPYSVATNLNISPQGSFTYTVPADVRDQIDLMFADTTVNCPVPLSNATGQRLPGERTPVPLRFRHLLTQVRFVFGANIVNYWRDLTVHSVTVENAANSGTWDPQADEGKGSWTNLGPQTSSYTITATADGTGPGQGKKPYSGVETEVWLDGYTMFLMPQTLPEGAMVAVNMSYIATEAVADSGPTPKTQRTFHLYLSGKQLRPGHTVTVEINSNYDADCEVEMVNSDGSITPETEIYPLPAKSGVIHLRLNRSGGGDSEKVKIFPDCIGMAGLTLDSNSTPVDSCFVSGDFYLHTTDNTSEDDRFIRLIIGEGHDSGFTRDDHIVVLKQRGTRPDTDDDDDIVIPDTQQPWGFAWPTPFTVVAQYSFQPLRDLDYGLLTDFNLAWIYKVDDDDNSEYNIKFDYDMLRNLVRGTANSPSNGLTNSVAINTLCHFLSPFGAVRELIGSSAFDDVGYYLNNRDVSNTAALNNAVAPYEGSAVLEAVGKNGHGDTGGIGGTGFVSNDAIEIYLPAIEELADIAATPDNPLVEDASNDPAGYRVYWSSTVDADGEPWALRVNADGTTSRTKPGASTVAWVHVKKNN